MNIAVIPARGGSKRIPGKNIKEFAGQPLVAYSIKAALDSKLFDKVVVSTDSDEIAKVAKMYGADVPFVRPAELSNDHVSTHAVIKHAYEFFVEQGCKPDYTCCIYATAPFLMADKLIAGLDLLKQHPAKSFAFSVTTFPFPIQRALRLQDSGVEPIQPSEIPKRSQDLEETYHDAGQFYWYRGNSFTGKSMFSQDSVPVILPRHLVQDIDTHEDWHRAELMYQAYIRGLQDGS